MISVVITAYKEPKTICNAIDKVLSSNIPERFEILVIAPDNETLDAAEQYSAYIRLIKDEGKGKPAALNLAFKQARGDIIVMTDGDVFVSKNAIESLVMKFRDPEIGIVSGRPISTSPRETMLGYWSHLLTDTADKIRRERVEKGEMIVCSGYLYAVRAGIVKEIPENALSEDAVLSHLIYDKGYKTGYAHDAKVYVKYPDNFSDWIKQKKRSAGGYNQLKEMVHKKERMRSFTKESAGIFRVLNYPRTLEEFFYTCCLIGARIYLWGLIFLDVNIRKKDLKSMWLRVESTK